VHGTWRATTSQFVISGAMCLLLTDIFFLNVKTVAFTGEPAREQSNLALTVLKYFAFFPVVAWLPVFVSPWIEASVQHSLLDVAAVIAVHWVLQTWHRGIILDHSDLGQLEDDEEEFPTKPSLRT
jgi:hypothetical protein